MNNQSALHGDLPDRQGDGDVAARHDLRSRTAAPILDRRPDPLIWTLRRALFGLALIASLMLVAGAVTGDPIEMLTVGAMGLILAVLMTIVWACINASRRSER